MTKNEHLMASALRRIEQLKRVVHKRRDDLLFFARHATISFLAGLTVLGLIHITEVRQSLLGDPDREMMYSAFKIIVDTRQDNAAPGLLLDIDNRTQQLPGYNGVPPGREPSSSTSRAVIADLLSFILSARPEQRPAAVIVDVELGSPAPDGPAAVGRLQKTLSAWANTPGAPSLMLARDALAPEVLGLSGEGLMLPDSDYDWIVANAPNIYWGLTKVLANNDGIITDFVSYQCVIKEGHATPLFSAAILAYTATLQGPPPADSPVAKIIASAANDCAKHPVQERPHGELINYHLSLSPSEPEPIWPRLSPEWPGFKTCGANSDAASFRRISAADVLSVGSDASRDLLCQRLVVIGGTNELASDFAQSPMQTAMAGPMILANATRGLEVTKGGLRQGSLLVQCGALLLVSLAITAGFLGSRVMRRRYHRYKAGSQHWLHHLALLPLNPIILNGLVAFSAHWIGVGLLIISLQYGYWGFLSGPAIGSAIAEAIQDFTEE